MAFLFFMGEVKAPILRHGARVKIVVGWAAVVKARIGGNYKTRESYICRARHRGWEGGIIPNPRQECAFRDTVVIALLVPLQDYMI
jgi:hypothetical protein